MTAALKEGWHFLEAGFLRRASRYHPIPISDEEEAQVERLRYILAHGAKEGLVASPREWPGVHCAQGILSDEPLEGVWFNRTKECAARTAGKEVGPRDFAEPTLPFLATFLTFHKIRVQ